MNRDPTRENEWQLCGWRLSNTNARFWPVRDLRMVGTNPGLHLLRYAFVSKHRRKFTCRSSLELVVPHRLISWPSDSKIMGPVGGWFARKLDFDPCR